MTRFISSRGLDEETVKQLMTTDWYMGERVGTYRPMLGRCKIKSRKIDYFFGEGMPYVQFEVIGSYYFVIYDEAFLE